VVVLKRRDEIIGLPAINKEDGKKLGYVKDIIVKTGKKRITGVLVESEGFLKRLFFIPLDKICVFGDVAVIVNINSSSVQNIKKNNKGYEHASSPIGVQVMTKDGNEIGVISNIILDESDGSIQGYEVSQGFFDDLFKGRMHFREITSMELSKDIAIVHDEYQFKDDVRQGK